MAPKSEEVPAVTANKDEKKPKKLTKEELEKKKEEDELSDEDKQLKEELELCVTRLSEFLSIAISEILKYFFSS